MGRHWKLSLALASVAGLTLFSMPGASADAASDFYSGRTITFICATGPAGDYALYSRLAERHIDKHIAGKPKVQIQFMPGAGGVKAANYLYNVAPKDGSVIGMPLSSIALNQVLRPEKLRYDAAKFSWIGVIASLPDVIAVWHTTKVRTLDDATKIAVNMASTSSSSQNYLEPTLVNALLGTKFNMIKGYRGSGRMDQAIEKGEVEGRMITWQTWTVMKPDWVKEGKVIPLLQAGTRRIPELHDVPAFIDLVKGEDEKKMVEMLHATTLISRALYAPPSLPVERLGALRAAFDAMVKDPTFVKDANSRGMAVVPKSGEEMSKIIARLLDTPEPLVAKFKKLAGFGG